MNNYLRPSVSSYMNDTIAKQATAYLFCIGHKSCTSNYSGSGGSYCKKNYDYCIAAH